MATIMLAPLGMAIITTGTIADPDDARYTNRVVTVTLVDLHLQSRLRMPGIDADDRQTQLIQLGP